MPAGAGRDGHRAHASDAFGILRRLGGREIAAMAGAVAAARKAAMPAMLDGVTGTAAIAPLAAIHPAIVAHRVAGDASAEPGHVRLPARLGPSPLLSLDMRLGEESGGAVAAGAVRAALAAHDGMATSSPAGVSTA